LKLSTSAFWGITPYDKTPVLFLFGLQVSILLFFEPDSEKIPKNNIATEPPKGSLFYLRAPSRDSVQVAAWIKKCPV
jgi:hypothetical protein